MNNKEVINLSLEEFNEKLKDKVFTSFEQYTKGIVKNIDNIRLKMCENTQEFIRGFSEETDNVFMLVEYHQLMVGAISTLKYSYQEKTNILDALKEIREYYINELLKLNVRFNSTSMTYNMRKVRKVEAYQQLIGIIDMQIKDCVRICDLRYKNM